MIWLLLLLLAACTAQSRDTINSDSIDSVSVSTDKPLYHSGEIIKLSVKLDSPSDMNNVTLKYYGILSGSYRLSKSQIVDVKKGENNYSLDYVAPNCFGCAGISPGTYDVSVDVIYADRTVGTGTLGIEIRQ